MTKKKKVPAGKKKTDKKIQAVKQTRKPEFEKALEEIVTDSKVRDESTRPGPSSQDPGAKDSQAPPDNLAGLDHQLSKASQALAPVLKIPFSIWATVSEIPEMKLADDEAQEWAEPIVALLEYYFPGKIPEIAWMWLMFLSATEKVIDSRVKIRYEKRQEHKRSQPAMVSTREPAGHTTQSAPIHNGAEPAQGYPKE